MPKFKKEEYDIRLAKVRKSMAEKNIEVLIVTDPSNMSWLTGYDGWSFYVHQCVVLTLEGEPLWYGRGMDANGAKRTVFMQNENIIGYADDYVQNPRKHPMDYLSEIFREKGWAEKTIGVEKDNYYFSASCLESLQKNLPESSFTDATGLVNWQRTVKSNQELEYMRKAARIVEKMYERILEVIEPGMRKNDLVAEIYHSGITGVEGAGGDYPAIVPVTPTGIDASAPHLTWDDRKIPNNSGTFFEIAGCYRRYHCPLCRTVYLGEPPKKYLEVEKAVLEGIEAGLDAAKPGNKAEDIDAVKALQPELDEGTSCDPRLRVVLGVAVALVLVPDVLLISQERVLITGHLEGTHRRLDDQSEAPARAMAGMVNVPRTQLPWNHASYGCEDSRGERAATSTC